MATISMAALLRPVEVGRVKSTYVPADCYCPVPNGVHKLCFEHRLSVAHGLRMVGEENDAIQFMLSSHSSAP